MIDHDEMMEYMRNNFDKQDEELKKSLESDIESALNICDKRERYEYVYDIISAHLDHIFERNNHCEFADGKCLVNRKDPTGRKSGGCCGSQFGGDKNERRPCMHLGERGCEIVCVPCKLYTCKSLRKKGVRFKIKDFAGVRKIFSKKQIEVLERNHFRSKERIINKLLMVERSKLPYFLFWFFDLAHIKC